MTRTSCSEAPGEPFLLIAIGTSESAGPGEYPELYSDMLCEQLGVPVELHGYYPDTGGLTPLEWWIERLASSEEIQADLAAADEVVMWAMSSHDIVAAQLWPGSCQGAWPEPLRSCLDEKMGHVPARTDELFGMVAGFVREDTAVLVSDAYAPPVVMTLPWWDEPYSHEIKRMIDPYFVVEPAAEKWGFTFVDTELVFNGESRRDPPADGLFQSDGLHPAPAGALLIAQTYAAADPFWSMVTISDSALDLYGHMTPGVAAADSWADLIEAELGVRVSVDMFYFGGSASSLVRDKVLFDAGLREAVGQADVILIAVPIGELKQVCPWESFAYRPAAGTAEEYAECGQEMAEHYAADAETIMAELAALRRPDALIRATNLWHFFLPRFRMLGLEQVTRESFRLINDALQQAADAHGIPVADAYTAFMGADGTADPVAAGLIGQDEVHMTPAGVAVFAQLVADLGYE